MDNTRELKIELIYNFILLSYTDNLEVIKTKIKINHILTI